MKVFRHTAKDDSPTKTLACHRSKERTPLSSEPRVAGSNPAGRTKKAKENIDKNRGTPKMRFFGYTQLCFVGVYRTPGDLSFFCPGVGSS